MPSNFVKGFQKTAFVGALLGIGKSLAGKAVKGAIGSPGKAMNTGLNLWGAGSELGTNYKSLADAR